MAPADDTTWLSSYGAAARLGITLRTLQWLVRAGEITPTIVGRHHRYPPAELERYLDAHRVQPGSLSHLTPDRGSSPGRVSREQPPWKVARQPQVDEARARAAAKRARAKQAESEKIASRQQADLAAKERAARQAAVVERYEAGAGADRIARELRIGVRTVYADLERAGVERRGRRQKGGTASFADVFTEEFLTAEYVTKRRTVQELAREVGCSESTVLNWLRRYGIRVRGRR